MRKLLGFVLVVLVLIGLGFLFRQKVNRDLSQKVVIPSVIPTVTGAFQKAETAGRVRSSIFVPYWTVGDGGLSVEDYDRVIYFGIAPNIESAGLSDEDTKRARLFNADMARADGNLLAVRMIGNDLNTKILDSRELRDKTIMDSIRAASDHGFEGIVLDLEMSAIPFESLVSQINGFVRNFSRAVKNEELTFSIAIYGDVFYRARPFDMKELSRYADEVLIMAYDFHKANGNPGPNFPLGGADVYGYDFERLTNDFLGVVPPDKLSVIFGMYGYDWVVDESGKSQGEAEALSYNEIRQKFLDGCEFEKCERGRDGESGEAFVKYIDGEGERHVVWYEDRESVERKKKFLRERGISSFSFWAYGYF